MYKKPSDFVFFFLHHAHETLHGNYHDSITCQLPGAVTILYCCCMHFLLNQNNFVDVWAALKDAAAALLQTKR